MFNESLDVEIHHLFVCGTLFVVTEKHFFEKFSQPLAEQVMCAGIPLHNLHFCIATMPVTGWFHLQSW